MFNEKDLSKEFKETMEETKGMLLAAVMESSVSTSDTDNLVTNVKVLRLFNRLLDLFGEMFEKENKLMDKMDKAMDKYLMEAE